MVNGMRLAAMLAAMSAAAVLFPASLDAHAVVYPKESKSGGFEKYVLRVPNERDVATTRVEIRFPRSVRVVSFEDVPGWSLEIVTDSAARVTGAIWTGSLAPQRFVEFPFIAVNPNTSVRLIWPAFQTYSSGERVDWVGRDENAKQPASVTLVSSSSRAGYGFVIALWVCIGALVLSLVALFLALRPERRASGFQSVG